ncbi:MAG: hypothetical protein WC985_06160 [Thermoplasmata archaeon]
MNTYLVRYLTDEERRCAIVFAETPERAEEFARESDEIETVKDILPIVSETATVWRTLPDDRG